MKNTRYSPQFREAHDYFRAIMKSGEKSQRALDLTELVIDCNAANYTVWYYRRLVLLAIKADLYKEYEFVDEMASSNTKNYQVLIFE